MQMTNNEDQKNKVKARVDQPQTATEPFNDGDNSMASPSDSTNTGTNIGTAKVTGPSDPNLATKETTVRNKQAGKTTGNDRQVKRE